MNENPICHEKELQEIIDLFRKSIESELQDEPDIDIDIEKLIQGFENKLRSNLDVLPNVEEKQVDRNSDNKIKKMQASANQIQKNLNVYHTNFIENVRTQIEQDLESKLPHIEVFEEEEDYMKSPELLSSLQLLDKRIEELQKKAIDSKKAIINTIEKYDDFEKNISSSLNNK